MESMVGEVEEQAVKFRQESIEEGILPEDFPVPYLTWPELTDGVYARPWLELGHSTEVPLAPDGDGGCSPCSATTSASAAPEAVRGIFNRAGEKRESVVVVSRQSERLQELWDEQFRPDDRVKDAGTIVCRLEILSL